MRRKIEQGPSASNVSRMQWTFRLRVLLLSTLLGAGCVTTPPSANQDAPKTYFTDVHLEAMDDESLFRLLRTPGEYSYGDQKARIVRTIMHRRPAWTIEATTRIQAGIVWAGMNEEQATLVLPRPKSVNRSTGSWGERQQWVIEKPDDAGTLYAYFENGFLTSWNESKERR